MDQAVSEDAPGESVRAWRQAYSAALSHPAGSGLLAVAAASLRLGVFPGLAGAPSRGARETYGSRSSRAQQHSLTGILHAAEAFSALGDRATVEQCLRVAEGLATRSGDVDDVDRVRLTASSARRARPGRGAQQRALEERRSGRQNVRRDGGARSVPAAAPFWREGIFLLLLDPRRGDREPSPAPSCTPRRAFLDGALGPVALKSSRVYFSLSFIHSALVATASRGHDRDAENAQRQGVSHAGSIVPQRLTPPPLRQRDFLNEAARST
jgi:hypothetical protein